MAFTLTIKKTKSGVTRSFAFEDTEIKSTARPNVSQAVTLSLVKDNAFDSSEDFTIDLGVAKELAIEWKLYKQTTDRSEGTNPTAITTYEEMLNYLEDVICFPGVGLVEYEVTITDKFRTRTAIYTFEDFNLDVGSSIYPSGTMKFKWKKQVV